MNFQFFYFHSWVKKDPELKDVTMFKIMFKSGIAVCKMERFLRIQLFRPMNPPSIIANDLVAILSG